MAKPDSPAGRPIREKFLFHLQALPGLDPCRCPVCLSFPAILADLCPDQAGFTGPSAVHPATRWSKTAIGRGTCILARSEFHDVHVPVPPYEVACYGNGHHKRLAALPGITGLWQVKGRGKVSFEEMIRMDLEYIHNTSLWQDLKILCLTVPAVLSRRGAE